MSVTKPIISLVCLASLCAHGEEPLELQQVYITGGKDQIKTQPGSATLIDNMALEQFEYTDIHRVLNEVPGINLQEEDGYGLRPNIGMRGSSPERSKKVTIMEDGILSGPAPYSAPAAYYFPNVSRMSAVEVFKGPSAIQYGPATVAGAINLVSRAIPFAPQGQADIQLGSFAYKRINAHYGEQQGDFSYVLEGLYVNTEGFKELPSDDHTGFTRNDINLKMSYDLNGQYRQRINLKLGYADETSNETYVGLSKNDFAQNPYGRYAASELDKMQWQHNQLHASHVFEPSLTSQVSTDVYYHTFARDWFKLNGFKNGTDVNAVLKDPDNINNAQYFALLTGATQSVDDATDLLMVGNNGRTYVSQGLQSKINSDLFAFGVSHQLEVGVRLHMDEIKRTHTQQEYQMNGDGHLEINAGSSLETSTLNTGKATALALHIKDDIELENTTVSLGLRSENIETTLTDRKTNIKKVANQNIILPGIGSFTQLSESLGILAGIHKGFVATAPGQEGDIDPEESINYEFGFRLHGNTDIEVVAFINDYSNLKESCSFSNGCDNSDLDSEFNGGEVLVSGLESNLQFTQSLAGGLSIPLNITYTFTQTEFKNSFTDDKGVFKDAGQTVNKGDELAYVPAHRLNIKTGIQAQNYQVMVSALYQSDMRDQAGQGSISEANKIDGYVVLDLAANYQISQALKVYGTIDNVLGREYLVAAKPMGYRPGKPRAIQLGLKFNF